MKFTVEKKALSEAMASVDRVVENRTTTPILANVLLEADEGLTITGTNLDMEMRVQIPANVETAGTTTVPSALLAKLARTLPADRLGELTLEMDETGHELRIVSARSHYSLPVLPREDFPSMQGPDSDPFNLAICGNVFAELLQRVVHSVCKEEARYYLCGAYLHIEPEGDQPWLTAATTDGKRLAKNRITAPQGATPDMPGIIIHERTVRHIIHWLESHTDDVAIQIDSRKIAVEAGPNRLTAKLIDGEFPDYERVIPQSNSIILDVDAEAIADAIGRIRALDTGKESAALVMDISDSTMRLSARTQDMASASEEITVDYTGDAFRMGFTIDLADTVFSAVPGKSAKLHLEESDAPAMLIPDEAPEMRLVLMGRRI